MAEESAREGLEDSLELGIDDLDQAAGGYIFINKEKQTVELIDDKTGAVLDSMEYYGRRNILEEKLRQAHVSTHRRGLDGTLILDEELKKLRETGSIY